MSDPKPESWPEAIQLKDVFGVFVLSANDVEFRTGSTSGRSFLVSDPEKRDLLGGIVEKIVSSQTSPARPWNSAERELIDELIPELDKNGLIASNGKHGPGDSHRQFPPLLSKPLAEARVAIVGHGVLGGAIGRLLSEDKFESISVIESSSVARVDGGTQGLAGSNICREIHARPGSHSEWLKTISDLDWIVAAQDSFEPEELDALNKAALEMGRPWTLVCFDGYEGWVGPTFVPEQTACFSCFQRRLFAGAADPKHVFKDPSIKVYRAPSPWSCGVETTAWVSLIASLFVLEMYAAMNGHGFTYNNFLSVHRLNMTFQQETVLRLPRCQACSDKSSAPRPNVFAHILGTRGFHGTDL
jgi:bacteriocin biosynthesis cyclodehydratase domain-containing protein